MTSEVVSQEQVLSQMAQQGSLVVAFAIACLHACQFSAICTEDVMKLHSPLSQIIIRYAKPTWAVATLQTDVLFV